ncbi:STAS domain-containing protein [Pseudoduganella umbonata]|uniref:RsbT co-antagonist protein RsbR n=1 Tax=Pseudoduganella umbonata TaxID=864828 RepID=A0A4P8HU83_9BURK|nr:STAS domain-containing protein [Pseudoduganella umbonata]MBB3223613.1 rsbT co-antagonist protein RsbR [Pseudoduganella umbonata]QCP13523.1 STAS domain-containing protein [Pseudoduganella umbonata]
MSMATTGHLAKILTDNQEALLEGWLGGMLSRMVRRDKAAEGEIRQQASRFLVLVARTVGTGQSYDFDAQAWSEVRQLLAEMSAARVRQGFSPTETASFIFSLKEPVFALLRTSLAGDPAALAAEVTDTGALFDRMGLYTIEEYQRSRESVIMRQQQELLELSTPVVQLWKDVLALPLIGTLDSARTQVVMENLLQKIIETGASIAIIDITGVPTVDTLVAQHLLKTVAAARLMGADCIISGIRPQIAQTIVHLGVNLEDVTTKATLADAFLVALKRVGATVVRAETAF